MKTVRFTFLVATLLAFAAPWPAFGQPAKPETARAKHGEMQVTFETPFPPYPYQARSTKAHGDGSIKVTFDERGKPVKAVMVKSTGLKVLDDNTVAFALSCWKSSGGKRATTVIHISYSLQ